MSAVAGSHPSWFSLISVPKTPNVPRFIHSIISGKLLRLWFSVTQSRNLSPPPIGVILFSPLAVEVSSHTNGEVWWPLRWSGKGTGSNLTCRKSIKTDKNKIASCSDYLEKFIVFSTIRCIVPGFIQVRKFLCNPAREYKCPVTCYKIKGLECYNTNSCFSSWYGIERWKRIGSGDWRWVGNSHYWFSGRKFENKNNDV